MPSLAMGRCDRAEFDHLGAGRSDEAAIRGTTGRGFPGLETRHVVDGVAHRVD